MVSCGGETVATRNRRNAMRYRSERVPLVRVARVAVCRANRFRFRRPFLTEKILPEGQQQWQSGGNDGSQAATKAVRRLAGSDGRFLPARIFLAGFSVWISDRTSGSRA